MILTRPSFAVCQRNFLSRCQEQSSDVEFYSSYCKIPRRILSISTSITLQGLLLGSLVVTSRRPAEMQQWCPYENTCGSIVRVGTPCHPWIPGNSVALDQMTSSAAKEDRSNCNQSDGRAVLRS